LPASNEASTHILKFDSTRFKHLSSNEFLVTRFAAHLGLETVDVTLDIGTSRPFLVVRRYDRVVENERVARLHQEDFCQATGRLPTQKYEKEGGPTFGEIAAIVRSDSSSPAEDLLRLVRWTIFCALSGNADAHAKNISLLYADRTRLAPFYDLVCTRAFPNVDTSLALSVGGRRDTSRLDVSCWEAFAEACGLGRRAVLRELNRQLDGWEPAFDAAERELRDLIDAPNLVATIRSQVAKRARELSP
jgi:serine/threonine-protein kinase HipA